MKIIKKPASKTYSKWLGYPIGLGLVCLATWLTYIAQPTFIPPEVPILYMLAIIPVAIFFGLIPSIFVCILSLLAYDYYFVPPGLFTIDHVQDAPILLIFFLIGIITSYLASNLRQRNKELNKEIIARKQAEEQIQDMPR